MKDYNWKLVNFKVMTDGRGDLIPIEYPKQLEFPLRRIYYIYNVKENVKRGMHSHYDLEQVLIAVHGTVKVLVKVPGQEEEFVLDNPSTGLYIGPMVWREMYEFKNDGTLLVLANHEYDEADYIRDYNKYEEEAKKYFSRKLERK